MQGRDRNILNHITGMAFRPVMQQLLEEKAQGKLKGVILTSAKDTFMMGGDLDYLISESDPSAIMDASVTLQEIFRDLERPGVPVVAAINGSALGLGFELALCCHHRIALNTPKIQIGHPEILIGFMPGSGGVIRLLWLLGIERAYEVLTAKHRYRVKQALDAGIIDEIADTPKQMMEKARAYLLSNPDSRRAWDRPDGKINGGTADDFKVAQRVKTMAAMQYKQTYGNYPAMLEILNTLVEGSKVDFDTACMIESRNFTRLVTGQVAANMTQAFWYDYYAIKEGISRPKGFGKFRPRKVGIIGAGVMGTGIAQACLLRGMEVVLKDVSKAIADRGKERIGKALLAEVDNGQIELATQKLFMAKLQTTEQSSDFETCDLVIEAVFENAMIKAKVCREAADHMDEFAILGSNTISIPITTLAEDVGKGDQFVGLHFFAPAESTRMVEIVAGKETSQETVARAFDFARAIKRIPIIVKDTWGFYVARVQNTYLLEGIYMLQEGYPAALIENLGLQAGMPNGALAMADDLGLEIALKYENQAAAHYGSKYIQHPAAETLNVMVNELKRQGRVKRAGFYEYQGEERRLWRQLTEHFPTTKADYDRDELTERLLFVQVLEAIWCMQEKVIQTVAEANLGSIHGWGFPACYGGVIQYVEQYGRKAFVERANELENRLGPRFRVPELLLKQSEVESALS